MIRKVLPSKRVDPQLSDALSTIRKCLKLAEIQNDEYDGFHRKKHEKIFKKRSKLVIYVRARHEFVVGPSLQVCKTHLLQESRRAARWKL